MLSPLQFPWSLFLSKMNEEPKNKWKDTYNYHNNMENEEDESKKFPAVQYSHGLPPKPPLNGINFMKRKKLLISSKKEKCNRKDSYNLFDAVVPADSQNSESSGEIRTLTSNFENCGFPVQEYSPCMSPKYPINISEQTQNDKQSNQTGMTLFPCATDMGPGKFSEETQKQLSRTIRVTLARIIRRLKGLSISTVEKWFSLLSHFLELSAEESLMTVILLRRYFICRGRMHCPQDHMRPQKWECVLGICSYFAKWLSEEFPGHVREDLKVLMGPRFSFCKEQIEFLKTIDWEVNIGYDEYCMVRDMFVVPDEVQRTLMIWEWLGYSTQELTENLDIRREVILNELFQASDAVNILWSGKKRDTQSSWGHSQGNEQDYGSKRHYRRLLSSVDEMCNHDNEETCKHFLLGVPNG
eukprot:jgi/Galph1/70/GphlegSOOS_G4860.1